MRNKTLGEPAVKVARIDDLDQPIYRIFPLWFFEEALRLKSIALISPSKWADPYEDICSNVLLRDGQNPGRAQKELSNYLMPAYAQCWSFENNSDILMRAYSRVTIHPILRRNMEPALEGVRVQSTPRKLIQSINAFSKNRNEVRFYLGRMIYAPGNEITQHIANTIARVGPMQIGHADNRAELLFLKRDYFRHEDEVRLLAIFNDRAHIHDPYRVTIDPNLVFTKVEFDPRLILFERREREASARNLGYTGEFGGEEEAVRILWDVVMPHGWQE